MQFCNVTRYLSNIQPLTSIWDHWKLVALYENIHIDKYEPMKRQLVSDRPKTPWINEEILKGGGGD